MTCLTCVHWKPKDSREMAQQGFARCAVGPRWQFNAPQHTCDKHQAGTADLIDKRRVWLAKA